LLTRLLGLRVLFLLVMRLRGEGLGSERLCLHLHDFLTVDWSLDILLGLRTGIALAVLSTRLIFAIVAVVLSLLVAILLAWVVVAVILTVLFLAAIAFFGSGLKVVLSLAVATVRVIVLLVRVAFALRALVAIAAVGDTSVVSLATLVALVTFVVHCNF
jgi:hypothetical protein